MNKILFVATVLISIVAFRPEENNQNSNSKARNLILISIDGLRWQEVFNGADSTLLLGRKFVKQDSARMAEKYWSPDLMTRRTKLMPFFWSTLAAQGQLYGNRLHDNLVDVKNKYWFSYPGRSESLCGFYDTLINSNEYPPNPNENVLEFLNKQKNYAGKVVAFASWNAVSNILNRDRTGILVNIPGEKIQGKKLTPEQVLANEQQYFLPQYFGPTVRWDVHTFAIGKSYMKANHPRVVHFDFADPDDLAHAGQYDSYLDAAHYLDAILANLWTMIQEDKFYKDNTTLMIYPDHGRGLGEKWTSHGRAVPLSYQTWLAMIGPKVSPKGEMKNSIQIYHDQFAQTAANFLGFKFVANHPVGEAIRLTIDE